MKVNENGVINSKETVFNGAIFNVEKREVTNPEEDVLQREVVTKAPVVVMVVVNQDGEVAITKEYRSGVNKVTCGLPAGIIDEGEKPIEAAQREVKEEIGYEVKKSEFIGVVNSSEGFTNEVSHLFAVSVNSEGLAETSFDEGERIETMFLPFDYILDMIRDGEIQSAQCISALLMFKLRIDWMKGYWGRWD